MVKIERCHTSVISTDFTTAALMVDSLALVTLESRDLEAVSTLPTVAESVRRELARIRLVTSRTAVHALRSQLILMEPVSHSSLRLAEQLCDLMLRVAPG